MAKKPKKPNMKGSQRDDVANLFSKFGAKDTAAYLDFPISQLPGSETDEHAQHAAAQTSPTPQSQHDTSPPKHPRQSSNPASSDVRAPAVFSVPDERITPHDVEHFIPQGQGNLSPPPAPEHAGRTASAMFQPKDKIRHPEETAHPEPAKQLSPIAEQLWTSLIPKDQRIIKDESSLQQSMWLLPTEHRISTESADNLQPSFSLLPGEHRAALQQLPPPSNKTQASSKSETPTSPPTAPHKQPPQVASLAKKSATEDTKPTEQDQSEKPHELSAATDRFRASFMRAVERAYTKTQVPDTRIKRLQTGLIEPKRPEGKETNETPSMTLDDYLLMRSQNRPRKSTSSTQKTAQTANQSEAKKLASHAKNKEAPQQHPTPAITKQASPIQPAPNKDAQQPNKDTSSNTLTEDYPLATESLDQDNLNASATQSASKSATKKSPDAGAGSGKPSSKKNSTRRVSRRQRRR